MSNEKAVWCAFVQDRVTYIQKPTGESWACGFSHTGEIDPDAVKAVELLNKDMEKNND